MPAATSPALVGLKPAAVLCPIVNDDGTMARRSEPTAFAARHDLAISIGQLIAFRYRLESLS